MESTRVGGRAEYLNRDLGTARAQVALLLHGSPVEPEDLTSDAFDLVVVALPTVRAVDVVSGSGIAAAGLPTTYPLTIEGDPVPHASCWHTAQTGHDAGAEGVEARSAAVIADPGATTELAWWPGEGVRARQVGMRLAYGRWRDPRVSSVRELLGPDSAK